MRSAVLSLCLVGCSAWTPSVGRGGGLATRPGHLLLAQRRLGPLQGLEIEAMGDEGEGEDEEDGAEEGINWMPPLVMTSELEKDEGAQVRGCDSAIMAGNCMRGQDRQAERRLHPTSNSPTPAQ